MSSLTVHAWERREILFTGDGAIYGTARLRIAAKLALGPRYCTFMGAHFATESWDSLCDREKESRDLRGNLIAKRPHGTSLGGFCAA